MDRGRDAVLVVEDDAAIARVVCGLLAQRGLEASAVGSAEEALAALERRPFDVVLSDVRLPGIDGVQLLDRIVASSPDLPVVLVTAHGSVALAVDAMKRGAADFVQKPFDRDELVFAVEKALAGTRRLRAEPPSPGRREMVAGGAVMRALLAKVDKVAATNATVLVQGETGTGKELVARAIHDRSPRRSEPFVVVHCAALPETLLESELFGHERGAFTGAVQRKPGRIELAHGGTLFLDEIGDVSLAVQVKLLRVLQERELQRLGGAETVRVDVRFVAATNRDLQARVGEGLFREDLYYRLAVVPLSVPPLRERDGDVARLARVFARGRLTDAAIEVLAAQPWPGNVRQLEHFIERLLVLSDASVVDRDEVLAELDQGARPAALPGAPASLDAQRRGVERDALRRALAQAGDNRTQAARILGVSRRTLYNKLREHGID